MVHDYRNDQDLTPETRLEATRRQAHHGEWLIPNGPQTVQVMRGQSYKFFIDNHMVEVKSTDYDANKLMIWIDGKSLLRQGVHDFIQTFGSFDVSNKGIFTTQDSLEFENGSVYFNNKMISGSLGKNAELSYAEKRLKGIVDLPSNPEDWEYVNLGFRTGDAIVGKAINVNMGDGKYLLELLRTSAAGYNVRINGKVALSGDRPLMFACGNDYINYGRDRHGGFTVLSWKSGDKLEFLDGVITINKHIVRLSEVACPSGKSSPPRLLPGI